MTLTVNGHSFSVAQLGPGFLMLRDAIDHSPAEAQFTMSIDGDERLWFVRLVDGIVATQPETRIEYCSPTHETR